MRNRIFIFVYLVFWPVNCQYYLWDKSECVFPFVYNGRTHHDCILDENQNPWCSLTKHYQNVWKYCYDTTKTNWKCHTGCSHDVYPACKTPEGKKKYCLDRILKNDIDRSLSCNDAYKKLSPRHTACLPKNPNVAKSGVTEIDKKHIVNLHNYWRRSVEVPAAEMQKIYWDDTLAHIAQKHADRCSFAHDDPQLRAIPGTGRTPGQNIVKISNNLKYNWTHAFNVMFKGEQKRWTYSIGTKSEFARMNKLALHYTQILLDQVSRVGCGYSECVFIDRIEVYFVCNYNYLQNSRETVIPYKAGLKFCENCPNTCDNNLCDCNGKECLGWQRLDVNTCKCV